MRVAPLTEGTRPDTRRTEEGWCDRLLAEETYRQAAELTPGSECGRRWQQRCGAHLDRIRVVTGPAEPGALAEAV
ncbi:hypothetical protein GCM10010430_45880 [Kitasatospora cystarginea]|uniref:Uncharacterized protein n=1 Tax=Kitasatospora cystarginea TaxID=58350 RepID=A0ABN3EF17_9ACTN